MIDLYVLENCPYCKKVREFLDNNNILYNVIDTKNDENALRLMSIGGKDQVPFMHDAVNNIKMYESNDIIEYLRKNHNV